MAAAPYPANTRAKGWRFELDYEQIEQSSTWAVAKPAARPWLLMMWMLAWKQVPCGSWPADEEVIAGALGIEHEQWALHRKALMRGWIEADDGRMYHATITKRVLEMMGKRRSDSDRQAERRAREAASRAEVTRDTSVTHNGVGSESSTDHRPPSNSSLPTVEKKARKRAETPGKPEGVDDQVWLDWLALRKAKRAPVTPTVLDGARSEAGVAGMPLNEFLRVWCRRGTQGLEAAWLKPAERAGPQALTFRERDEANAAARVFEMTGGLMGRRKEATQPETIDANATPRELVGPDFRPDAGSLRQRVDGQVGRR